MTSLTDRADPTELYSLVEEVTEKSIVVRERKLTDRELIRLHKAGLIGLQSSTVYIKRTPETEALFGLNATEAQD